MTVSVRALKGEVERGRVGYVAAEDVGRPVTRADCVDGARPCPFVSCKHHLFLDVSGRTGALKLNFPDLEPEELTESCVLDVADRGGATLEELGAMFNMTRERVRQIEHKALQLVRRLPMVRELRESIFDHEQVPSVPASVVTSALCRSVAPPVEDVPVEKGR